MALQPWRKGKVIRIEEVAPATLKFGIQVPELEHFDFEPGQFVTLDLPIHEKPNKRWRSYSIASWPDGTNIFDLIIVLNESGSGTPWLFSQVKLGDELTFRGPQGVFTLPAQLDRDLFLICTGTGIAPFRSMIHFVLERNIPHKEIYLIFGTRKKEHLLFFDELNALSIEHPSFQYIPVLSREEWAGRTGYVHSVYEAFAAKHHPAYFFLCGWKNMIDEAKKRILDMGYERKDIHQELYG
jgi:CDP-4-dehydro-6-deoxyglucose reductase